MILGEIVPCGQHLKSAKQEDRVKIEQKLVTKTCQVILLTVIIT